MCSDDSQVLINCELRLSLFRGKNQGISLQIESLLLGQVGDSNERYLWYRSCVSFVFLHLPKL